MLAPRWLDGRRCQPYDLELMTDRSARRDRRFVATDDPRDLPPPRLPEGADAGWAVSELFEAAWVISGRDPDELRRSPRSRGVDPRAG
jgi:hypothetical protein